MTEPFPHITANKDKPNVVRWFIGRTFRRPVLVLAKLALRLNPTVTVIANTYAHPGVSVFVPNGGAMVGVNVTFSNDLAPAIRDATEHLEREIDRLNEIIAMEGLE